MTAASTAAAADVAKSVKATVNGKPPPVVIARHKHTLDVYLASREKRLLKINHEHYAKLRAMWSLRKGGGLAGRDEEEGEDEEFQKSLFSLLQRYGSLQGHGFQAACPEQVSLIRNMRVRTHAHAHTHAHKRTHGVQAACSSPTVPLFLSLSPPVFPFL